MLRIAPGLVGLISVTLLLAGCSSSNENTGGVPSGTQSSPSSSQSAPVNSEEAIQQAVIDSLVGYMESMNLYDKADFDGFASEDFDPATLDTLIQPTLKFFYTGDLEGEDLEGAKSIIAMSIALYLASIDLADDPAAAAAATQASIDSLRDNPSQVTITVGADGKTLKADSTITGPIDMVQVGDKWLISLSGLIDTANSGLDDSGIEAPPAVDDLG